MESSQCYSIIINVKQNFLSDCYLCVQGDITWCSSKNKHAQWGRETQAAFSRPDDLGVWQGWVTQAQHSRPNDWCV